MDGVGWGDLVAALGDVVGHVQRLLHVLHDDVVLAEGSRRHRLLVAVLAVNHATHTYTYV